MPTAPTDPTSDDDVTAISSRGCRTRTTCPPGTRSASATRSATPEQDAGRQSRRSRQHANRAHLDALGRTFLTVAHNRFERNGAIVEREVSPPGSTSTSKATSARCATPSMQTATCGRIVMRYDYDMLGNRIHQASMEAGERWMLNDVDGQAHPRLGQPRASAVA